jgi:hypothetical protein
VDTFFFLGKDVLLATLFQFPVRNQIEGSSQFHVEAPKRKVVGRVPEVSNDGEWLLDAERIVRTYMPVLFCFCEKLSEAQWQDMVVIVKLVGVEAEELEQEHGKAFLILAAEPCTQLLQVVAEFALGPILPLRLFLLTCVECREDGWLPQLEESDNQAYPCIGTQSAAKSYAEKGQRCPSYAGG